MSKFTSAKKTIYRIGFDLSIIDRVQTGTSVYADNLFKAMTGLDLDDFEFIALRAPRPLGRKNIFTKFINFAIEIAWLLLLLPVKARLLRLDLYHSPANTVSPLLRIPQACTIHDAHFITYPEGRDPLWRLYAGRSFRYAAKHADRIICDTNAGKEEIVRLLQTDPEKIEVIYLGLPHRESTRADRDAVTDLKPYILTVGATDPNKNLTSLLRAFAILVKGSRNAGHRLVLAGPAGRDHSALESIIKREGLEEDIFLLGRVTDSKLAALYENASLFVFPSFCEGFGFPPLEAMNHGVPVVASNAPCIPETLGDAAIFFDPHDIDEIAIKMEIVLSDERLQKDLSLAGITRSEKFTWEETAIKTVNIYRYLLDQAKVT